MALELANLRELPGLAHRPDFPRDLHVLLLDPDFNARQEAEVLLRENHYSVTPCSCSVEAAAFLANPGNSCDVLLADVQCLQQKSAENAAVVQAAKSIPLVLMSESGAPHEVMLGIKLGAVDFLEKPLSPLKLKNIWQHLVRRLLSANTSSAPQTKKAAAASGTASPEDSGSQGGGAATHSHGSGGESGSNASTSDQAPVKVEYDHDMETSSFQETMGCMAALAAELPLATGALAAAPVGPGGAADDPMQLDGVVLGSSGGGKSRPQPQKYKASRGLFSTCLGTGGTGSSGGPKPCIGYPAGQMPPLPEGIPGIEWGLPTNPLQISPKAPMNGLLAPMGCWPGAAMMAPPLFPMMLGSPSPSLMSGCCGTLPMSSSCLTLSSGSNASGSMRLSMKRADSAPLPAMSGVSGASTATTTCTFDGFLQPPAPSLQTQSAGRGMTGSGFSKADLFVGMETGKCGLPPIGLQLKKSPSLADFISQTLGDRVAAC